VPELWRAKAVDEKVKQIIVEQMGVDEGTFHYMFAL